MKRTTAIILGSAFLSLCALREFGLFDFALTIGNTNTKYSSNDFPVFLGSHMDQCDIFVDGLQVHTAIPSSQPPIKVIIQSRSLDISALRFLPLIHLGSNIGSFRYQFLNSGNSLTTPGEFSVLASERSFGLESARRYKIRISKEIKEFAVKGVPTR